MKKNLLLVTLLVSVFIIINFSFVTLNHPLFSSTPPQGRTGATGSYCNACHAGTLNTAGGNVVVAGLPTMGYVAGNVYNFSLTINHSVADRFRWGFSIKAVNSVGADVGIFTTINPIAQKNGNELSHKSVPILTTASNTFTFIDLTWTAPPAPGINDQNITFYFVGNAANGNGANSGDFIYAATVTTAFIVPVSLTNFTVNSLNNKPQLNWKTEQELNTNFFAVEKSYDATNFTTVAKIPAAGNSSTLKNYSYTDTSKQSGTKIFYRLRIVDIDGHKTYSDIKVYQSNEKNNEPKLYPNPISTNQKIHIEIQSEEDVMVKVKLYNTNNISVKEENFTIKKGVNAVGFYVPSKLAAGVYVVEYYLQKVRYATTVVLL